MDVLSLFCLRRRVCLRCCLSLLPFRFGFSEEGERCRIFRVSSINNVLLYFGKLYMKSVL